MEKALFAINPGLDRPALARRFAERTRVQIRNVLTPETAREIQSILQATRWSLAMRGGDSAETPPQTISNAELATPAGVEKANRLGQQAHEASARGDYGFRYAHYPIVEALNQRWDPGGPYELLLEYLNAPDFLEFVREVTGIPELVRADGQATLYAAQHYLGRHIDSHVAEGWRVAYVLNLARDDWHPDWGGYLTFLDDDGDIVEGFRPRFNALNLFAVPQSHAVTYVPPFAPVGRYAITGWLRDR
ncbi:MAG: 2OG-Fe(II) oxygenase [Alphaproteobacteria bacterium]|jgi:SM-20-related protein|nr:2OG-Fe(II) oxygenase [Alphaproteobacteria bacterium]MBU1757145.1 2OG-Fe(II) oxygenase [Alphaproteobacteria bacterium]MBU2341107.1 2OG-Fe(II) oxygenase [Alphaproteobacteria bacterium]